jgi:putative FmdB family regulatory protein
MPIYEYRRPDGTTFEVQQSFSDDALTADPDTGVPVERVLHPPAVHFKGKGFYNTDYGTRKRQRETAAAAEGSGKDSSSDDSSGKESSGKESAAKESAKDRSSSSGDGAGAPGSSGDGAKGEKGSFAKGSGKPKDAKPAAGNKT